MMTILRRCLEAALILLVVGVAGLALATKAAPLAGAGLYAIRSESMAPALAVGDLVVVERVDPELIVAGDVITIRLTSGATVTHRVVAVVRTDGGPIFQTQGDANGGPDAVHAVAEQVVGREAFSLPLLGFLLAMISMPTGIAAIFSVGATLLTATWLLDEVEAADEDDDEELAGLDPDARPDAFPDARAATP